MPLNHAAGAVAENEGAGSPLPRATLDKSPFRERKDCRSTDNEVIQHANIDKCQRLLEGLGQGLVCVTGLGATGRVVVHVMFPESFCAQGSERFVRERGFFGRRHITTVASDGRVSPAELDGWLSEHKRPAPTKAVGAGKAGQRLVSQLSSEGSSFQEATLFEPDGEHSAMASVFMRMVISA